MIDDPDLSSLFEASEASYLRSQALDLFDRCLASNNPALMIAFIERQVTQEPPPLALLRAMDEDLQQRLHSLRTHRFDVRGQVIKAVYETTGVDLAPLAPLSALEQYHALQPGAALKYIMERFTPTPSAAEDLLLLAKLLEASVETVGRLRTDIQLTIDIHDLVVDWLTALSNVHARRTWSDTPTFDTTLH